MPMNETGQTAIVSSTRRTGLSLASMFAYGTGNFAMALLGLVVAVNLQFFYTDYVGLSAGLVAWSLLLARLFDAFTDPLMGHLSDRTNTRWGRRRPYFLGAAIPLSICFYFLFSPPAFDHPEDHQGLLWGYMLAWYVAMYFVWTIASVPYYSLGAELTDDYQERVKVIAVREVCSLTGLLLATVLPAYLIYYYGVRQGYSFMAAILGVGLAVFLMIAGLTTKERKEFQGRPSMGPYKGWLQTMRNPHFRALLWAFVFSAIAAAIPGVLVMFISTYIVGTPDWWFDIAPAWLPPWSYYLLIYFFFGMLALPLWNWISHSLGKRVTWAIALFISAAGSLGCGYLSEGTVTYMAILFAILGAAFSNNVTLPPSMVADVIDWDEAETGKRREGSYFAIWAFATKFCVAVAGFTSLQVLDYVGYAPGEEQTELVKKWLLIMYSWFPALFYLLAGIALYRFKFSRSDLDEAQRRVGREEKI